MKHRESFLAIYKSRAYQYFFSALCIYICISPLIILESQRDSWQLSPYNVVEEVALLLMLDPILVLVFIGTVCLRRPEEIDE